MIEIGLKVGDTFLMREMEFKVVIVDKKKNRIGAIKISDVLAIIGINDRFLIGDTSYIVTYVKDKSKYVSLIPICYGH